MSFSLKVFSRAPISWPRVGRAVEFYTNNGFTPVETPWRVSVEVFRTTSPASAVPLRCRLPPERPEILVGSAEQGLLTLMPTLSSGRYLSVSPCFRDGERDDLHFADFVKVELCVVAPLNTGSSTMETLRVARDFFLSEHLDTEVVTTDIGFDLEGHGVEVGSYGHRTATVDGVHVSWVYGTGLAEPRFSQALQRGPR